MPAALPLVALDGVSLRYGAAPLFKGLDVGLLEGERACLVGRNGSGKSTLLKLFAGEVEADEGERTAQAGVKVAYLPQDPLLPPDLRVADYVGLGLDGEDPSTRYRIDAAVARLKLDGQARLGSLSGGEGRRAALARCLVSGAQVLLLDEPTNHLDLPTIEWLEDELLRFRGALLVISHDRAFLRRISTATLWLDRGRLHRLNDGFERFDAWADSLRDAEEQELRRLGKAIEREEHWLHRGVTARRKRNMGRLARLQDLRGARAAVLRNQQSQMEMTAAEAGRSGKLVIGAENISKSFTRPDGEPLTVIDGFSCRIRRGDRIGIVGRNGAGKTTLIKLLVGLLPPDTGSVTLGTQLEVAVFDQRRASLDTETTLWRTLAPHGDSLMVGGRQKHVVSYLRDFLFDESQANQPVKSLSGGEKNRLLLAKLFAQPSNLLVLDEPTNDLDMDTLDLLVEVLGDYEGTLLLVSHDRDFLDRLATSVILLDGQGGAREYPGGYSDAIRQAGGLPSARGGDGKAKPNARAVKPKAIGRKLSYKDQRELDGLPEKIAGLQRSVDAHQAKLADPDHYARAPKAFERASAAMEEERDVLSKAEDRWLELEELQDSLANEAMS